MRGLYEIQLVTGQLPEMTCFYERMLGLPVSVHDERRGRTHLRLETGQLILVRAGGEQMLADWPGLPPMLFDADDEPQTGPAPHGPVHFALHVDEAQWDEAHGTLQSAGIELRGPLQWPDGAVSCYFRDPDGNGVELLRTA